MASMPEGYRALVVGASGGIGSAFVEALRADARCGGVDALHRRSTPRIDFDDASSIAGAASTLSGRRFHLVINAVGVLHGAGFMPEKKLGDLDEAQLLATFRANAIGPALLIRQFAPLLDPERALMVMVSARVGSIGDNRLGGWYGYRASKAALNMIVRTASIELRRTAPNAAIVALHPGTVDTQLSAPFRGAQIGRPPAIAVARMLAVVDALKADDSGSFVAYDGTRLPW